MKSIWVIVAAIVIGGAVSFLSLLPILRHTLSANETTRKLGIVGFAMLAFLVASPGWMYLAASAGFSNFKYNQEFMNDASLLDALQKNRYAVINEIWLRQSVPVQWSQNCYSGDPAICDLANRFFASPVDAWLVLVQGILASLICGASLGILVRVKNVPGT